DRQLKYREAPTPDSPIRVPYRLISERHGADTQDVKGPVLVIAAALLATGCGAQGGPMVHADGRIGPFRLDQTTETEVRAKLGKPDGVIGKMDPEEKDEDGGRTVVQGCGWSSRAG